MYKDGERQSEGGGGETGRTEIGVGRLGDAVNLPIFWGFSADCSGVNPARLSRIWIDQEDNANWRRREGAAFYDGLDR